MRLLLMISGYELGQWLRIVLWIGLPAGIMFTLVTTWLHYRRRLQTAGELLLAIQGLEDGPLQPERPTFHDDGKEDGRVDRYHVSPEEEELYKDEDYKENLYRGILWMKEKYERYRDLSDERYEHLREQLTRVEKKYEELLASVTSGNGTAIQPASEEFMALRGQLEEKQRIIDDLVAKLQNNSQLLMKIYQELDRSIHYNETPSQ